MGGVHFRTLIDGPFGSTARTRWGDYSSVLVVAGGSGVSYGDSILGYYCLCMSGRVGRYLAQGSAEVRGRQEDVIWLVREYCKLACFLFKQYTKMSCFSQRTYNGARLRFEDV